MRTSLFVLVVLCLMGSLQTTAEGQPEESSSTAVDGPPLARRYAESTIASDISKIMDSMVQKNFVNFLLNQREKKSEPLGQPEDAETRVFNNLLKNEISSWLHSKGQDTFHRVL
uniref:Gastric inhibitory polypeptide n=1 Tax=Denticeps clupeoides TaxID=299321 RepID=A0AAY4DHB2_9TELE